MKIAERACNKCGASSSVARFLRRARKDGSVVWQGRCVACTKASAATYNRTTVTRECGYCASVFAVPLTVIRHDVKRGRARTAAYCSRECHAADRRNPERRCVRECQKCAAPFETWTNRVIPQKYCSPECAGIKADPVGTACETCGEQFYLPPGKAKHRRYCSRQCAAAGYPTSNRPPIITRFHGKRWRQIREQVLRRDGGRCRLCETHFGLHVHHVIPWADCRDDSPANLVTLCASCHTRAEMALRFNGEILCDNGVLQ